jgi:4-hydroxy-3-methylbut-2-enyl diphosphate reductase
MEIIVAEHHGFCFGVRDAVKQAQKLAESGPLTVLGELVHNPLVLERLRERGAHVGKLDNLASAPTRHVLITAHGAADERRRAWQSAGYQVSDTTCPLVKRAHAQLAALVAAGYFPVVVGQANHVEVRGLTGDFPEAAVIETEADIARLPLRSRYGVISQTTQPLEKALGLVSALRLARPEAEVRYCDTVCQPTKDRQNAMQKLIAQAEVIIVVGGKSSNNTRQLALAAESAGRRAYQIERPEELQPAWVEGVARVGLTAGTSTLPETVEAVLARLEEIARLSPVP